MANPTHVITQAMSKAAAETSWIDRFATKWAPGWAARRMHSRMQMAVTAQMGQYQASTPGQETDGWKADELDPDEALGDRWRLMRFATDLATSSRFARAIINTKVTRAVGPGMRYKANVDPAELGMTPQQADQFEDDCEGEWRTFADTPECDHHREHNFDELCQIAARSAFTFGDIGVLLPFYARPGSPYETKIQLLESMRICDPQSSKVPPARKERIVDGLERGPDGDVVRYWVADHHPWSMSARNRNWQGFPAFHEDGRPAFILHKRTVRVGQGRGEPLLAPVIVALKQLSRYSDAELMAAVINAFFTAFVTTEHGAAAGQGGLWQALNDQRKSGDSTSADERKRPKLGHGNIVNLKRGQDIKFAQPGRPNPEYADYYVAAAREIAAATDVPYDAVIKVFQTSYSSAMATNLEGWRSVLQEQRWMAVGFCEPIKDAWFREAALKGRIDVPGFLSMDRRLQRAYSRTVWLGPAQGQIRADVETGAAIDRVEARLSSLDHEAYALTGQTFEEVHRQRMKEQRKQADDGMSADPREDPPDPQEDPPDPDAPDDEGDPANA